jgi:hypothetical protein
LPNGSEQRQALRAIPPVAKFGYGARLAPILVEAAGLETLSPLLLSSWASSGLRNEPVGCEQSAERERDLNDADAYAKLVEKGKLLFMVPRRDVRKWAAYVDREIDSRPGATRVSIIREHISTLDAKSGPMTSLAGILVAGCAILGSVLFGGPAHASALAVIIFIVTGAATLLSTIYSISALGVEWPEDANAPGAAAFEFRLLQRLVYRARNHAWGLRSAQLAAFGTVLILSELMARWNVTPH